ncbi:MAG: hypothetical protein Kow0074_10550 [Candidatus Zixiibacteriota bacterium]
MKLLRKLIVPTLVFAWASVAVAAVPIGGPYSGVQPAGTQVTDLQTWIDINNLLMFVTNTGSFAYDQGGVLGKSDGLYYPRGTNRTVIFAGGFWMGAKVNGDIRIALAEYSDEFVPGPFGSDKTLEKYRVYKIRRGDTRESNPDYAEWPFEDGAPALKAADGSDSLDADGNLIPGLIGDMTLWSVFNDGDPTAHNNDAGDTEPLNIEVHSTTFAFERTGALGNAIFIRLKIFNKGADTLKDAYVNTWADPDLGDAGDDLVGCDTILSLGYCYNAGSDQIYGAAPPAVGYDFFQGPMVPSENPDDSALAYGQWFKGFRNLPMTSFNKYINGTDPGSAEQSYNYMQGLQREGAPHVNPTTGEVTTFVHSGDPVTGVGWLDSNPADRRYFLSSGPFDMAPGDSQEVVIGIIVGQGADRLTSITALKFFDQFAQSAFDNNFQLPSPPAAPVVEATALDQAVVLKWGDTSEVDPGDYAFEGYNVYQGLTSSGPWEWLATFDVENEITVIFDQDVDLDYGVVVERPVQRGSDSGIRRYIHITQDKFEGRPLRNYTDYYFAVTAYSYKEGEAPNNLENPFSTGRVKVTPQPPTAGIHISGILADTIKAEHTEGPGDGSAFALVIDPSQTTGHDYEIGFEDDGAGGFEWFVFDVTDSTRVVTGQSDQSGTDDKPIFDGLMVKVFGPPPGVKSADMFDTDDESQWGWSIPNGTRRFTWANADGFHWEGFRGAIGWGGPGDVNGFGSHDPVPPANLVNVLLKLAPVSEDGTFDPNHEDVSYAYRYLRGPGDPARPEFEPYIITDENGSYGFQDFNKSVPLSAWNMDVDPPQRLAVGFLENNAENGLVDGKYWPGDFNVYNNTAGDGPREWLWIYLDEYSETPNPAYMGNAIDDPIPIMYWLTVNRRGNVPFEDEDEFAIFPNKVNSTRDVFTFSAPAVDSGGPAEVADDLSKIKVVPNPYYAFSTYEPDQFERQVRFTNLPEKCTIRIFNLGGDLVRTLTKDDPSSFAIWDLQTENDILVSSGLYVYVVTDASGAEFVGKMAVFVEIEQLNVY